MCTELVLDPQGRLAQMNRLPGDNDVGFFLFFYLFIFKIIFIKGCFFSDAFTDYNDSPLGGNGCFQDENENSGVPRGPRHYCHL